MSVVTIVSTELGVSGANAVHEVSHLIVEHIGASYTANVNSSFNQGIRALATNTYKNPIYVSFSAKFLLSAELEVRKAIERCLTRNADKFTCLLKIGDFSIPFNVIEVGFGRTGSELSSSVQLSIFVYPSLGDKFSSIVKEIGLNVLRQE